MASTADLPLKSTQRMERHELHAEALRLGLVAPEDLEDLRRVVKAELEQRWKIENREAIQRWNRWYEKHGDPLAHLRTL